MRQLSQDFLNRVEHFYEQLLPDGLGRRGREAARAVLKPLYEEGAGAKEVARFFCAVDSPDPRRCVVPLSERPRPSRNQEARKPAARLELPEPGSIVLTKPRTGGKRPSGRSENLPPQRGAAKSAAPAAAADGPVISSRVAPARGPRAMGARALGPIVAALGWERSEAGADLAKPVLWEPERETNAFMVVLGGSGSGKSELLKGLAVRARASVPVVVLDFHGDLTGLGLPEHQAGRGGVSINPLALSSADPKFGGPGPQAEAVLDAVRRAAPGFGRVQEVGLREAIAAAYGAAQLTEDPQTWVRPAPQLRDVREQVRTALRDPSRRQDHRSLAGVLAAIDAAFADAAFRGEGELSIAQLLASGGHLDLSRLSRSAQVLAADALLRQVFGRLRAQGVAAPPARYRVLVIADEASLLKGAAVLDELFKEARKFGLALVLASQESGDFSASVRANAATLVALRTNSAKEAGEYARELSGVSGSQILRLSGPGAGYLRNHDGTRAFQAAPASVEVALSGPVPGSAPASAGLSPAAQPAPPRAVQADGDPPAPAPTTAATGPAPGPAGEERAAQRYAAGRIWIAGKTKKPPGKGQIARWEPIVARKLADPAVAGDPLQRRFWEGVHDFLEEARASGKAAPEAPAAAPRAEPPPDRRGRATKLRQLATAVQRQIDELRHSGTHSQRPTARRARIAHGQDQQADRLDKVRAALLGLARALEGDCLPASLEGADRGDHGCLQASVAGIDTRVLVEELLSSPRFPAPGIRLTWLKDLIAGTAERRSLAAAREAARGVARRCGEYWCGVEDLSDIAALEKLAGELRKDKSTRRAAEESLRGLLPFKRALAAGIHSQEEWERARADLVRLSAPTNEPTPVQQQVKEQERQLLGQRIPGYFPTPSELARRVVRLGMLRPGLRVLEPEAGKGDIAEAIREEGLEPDVIEVNPTLRRLLELKGFRLVGTDFLEFGERYDRILMNPPFEANQDIRHVRHAFELLEPGGRLVAIMGEGAFFRRGGEETVFRTWLERNGGTSEKLPDGSFLHSDRSTGVAARLVTLDKPNRPAESGPNRAERSALDGRSEPATTRPACPQENQACKLGLLGGACGLPAALVLAAPAGAPVPQLARYCLARASRLVPSHSPRTFAPRRDYPAQVQERRYEADQGEQLKVLRIAQDLNPAIIFNTSPSVTDGTPVVTPEGIVLGGNGRTLGLQRHYLDGGGVAKPYLVQHAAAFGFSPEDVQALADPVVVRVVDPGTDGLSESAAKRRLQHLVRVLNVPLTKELDQQASAVALARQLDEGVYNTLATALDEDKTLTEYLHGARSRDLVVELQRVGVLRETNLSTYVGSGGFTDAGRRLLEKTLAAALVEDASVLEALGEGTQATLARGAPWLVAATAYGAEWDVRPLFLAAARDVLAMRRAQIRTAAEYLRQNALFAAESPPSAKLPGGPLLLAVLAELAAAPLRLARFARSYYDDARRNLSTQASLFAAEKITPLAALGRAAAAAGVSAPPSTQAP